MHQLLDEQSAFGLAQAVGDECGAAHLAEHACHLCGELHLGTVAHLGLGAGVSHGGLILTKDNFSVFALVTDGRSGASGELED